MDQNSRYSENPEYWRDRAMQAFSMLQEAREVLTQYDQIAESLLRKLEDTLTTVVDLLEAGQLAKCLEVARIAREDLQTLKTRGAVDYARAQLGWPDEQHGG